MLDFIAKGFSLFIHPYTVLVMVSLGFLVWKKDIFGKAFCILLFSLIFNSFLKSLWQIPLPSHVGHGFAFPSGHMQSATVLWGWLAFEFRNKIFTGFVLIVLFGIAFELVHFGYHIPRDVAGGMFFGLVLLIAYYFFTKITWIKKHPEKIGVILAILSIPFMLMLPQYPTGVWIAEGGLIGFSLGWMYQKKYFSATNKMIEKRKNKIILVMLAFLGLIIIEILFTCCLTKLPKPLSLFLRTLLITLWIAGGALTLFRAFFQDTNRR